MIIPVYACFVKQKRTDSVRCPSNLCDAAVPSGKFFRSFAVLINHSGGAADAHRGGGQFFPGVAAADAVCC